MTLKAIDKFTLIEPFLRKEIHLSTIAEMKGINLRTLQRWVTLYNNKGLSGLERKGREDKDVYRKITVEIRELIEGLALQKQTLTTASITRYLEKYCIEQNIEPTNYYTVRKVIKNIPKDMNVLAKYGDKAYENLYEVIMRRESRHPNEMWQDDHSLLSIKVQLDNGKEDFPWLTIIMDDFSRCIMGFSLFIGAPSAIQTALTLRNAIWYKHDENWPVCGIPEVLYTDHGKDFTSTHIDYVCADLKIKLKHSIVGKPKGRGKVERFFSCLEQRLLISLKSSNKAYSLAELNELIKDFILNDYHHSIHGTTHETPLNLWKKSQIIPQMPESLEKLNLLLLTTKKSRIVQRDGIRFANLRYFHPNLVAYVGEPITLRFEPNDLAEIWVYDEQNKCICKAVCEEFQDQNITYEELKIIRTNRKKDLKKEIKFKVNKANQFIHGKKIEDVKITRKPKSEFKLYQNE